MLTLLTTTGARPDAWAICEKLMLAQTFDDEVRWIIVDDGEQAQPITFQRAGWKLQILRPRPYWLPGDNTQARNLRAGLCCIRPYDRVLIIEDDDYYAPQYLQDMSEALNHASLVGEERARYYNIRTRHYKQLQNRGHSSLASTALRGEAIEALHKATQRRSKFIDLELWKEHLDRKLFPAKNVVGIKGLPGRPGIGIGHKAEFGRPDVGDKILREWLGEDAKLYA